MTIGSAHARLRVIIGLQALAGLAWAAPARGQESLIQVGLYEWFDLTSTMAGDLDGDGVDDVVIGSTDPWEQHSDSLRAWSGATGAVLWSVWQSPGAGFAAKVVDVSDIDGDGTRDVAVVGEPGVALYSGADGAELWKRTDAASHAGATLARAGDLDGDGLDEVLVGTPQDLATGSARVHSGATGAVLLLLAAPASSEAFGAAVAVPGDVNGDGYDDLAVADLHEWFLTPSTVTVFSGRGGAVIHVLQGDVPAYPWSQDEFGRALADPGDVDLDGVPDLLVGLETDLSAGQLGQVRVHSGADGSLVLGLPDEHVGLAGLGDADLDGRPDLVLSEPFAAPAGRIRVLSGVGGAELAHIDGVLAGDYFGLAMRRAGDIDGDGTADLLVNGCVYAEAFGGPFLPGSVGPKLQWSGVEGSRWGAAVAVVGDADGDGVGDVAVGAPGHGEGGSETGLVRLFSGLGGDLLWERAGDAAGLQLGSALSAVGDLDGDGRADVLAGAPQDGAAPGAGQAWALSGADGSVLAAWHGAVVGDRFGLAVAGPGDLDEDGLPDVAVGAPLADGAYSGAGLLQVLPGAGGPSLFALEGSGKETHLGWAIAATGDVDADGLPDLAVGEPGGKSAGGPFTSPQGFAHVLGPTGSPMHFLVGGAGGSLFGAALSRAGDVDGDGHADVLVGAPATGGIGGLFESRATLYAGATGLALASFVESDASASAGAAVAGGADVDADGWPDLLIGSPDGEAGMGQVHLVSGAALSLSSLAQGQVAGDRFGAALALADLDLDGFAEAVIGAPADAAAVPGLVIVQSLAPPWSVIDAGLPGEAGTPSLAPKGSLVAGVSVELRLSGAAAVSAGRLFLGLHAATVPFKGGVLVPSPDAIIGFVTDPAGTASFAGTWPGGLPTGSALYAQAWIVDAGAVQGVAASNALLGTAP